MGLAYLNCGRGVISCMLQQKTEAVVKCQPTADVKEAPQPPDRPPVWSSYSERMVRLVSSRSSVSLGWDLGPLGSGHLTSDSEMLYLDPKLKCGLCSATVLQFVQYVPIVHYYT